MFSPNSNSFLNIFSNRTAIIPLEKTTPIVHLAKKGAGNLILNSWRFWTGLVSSTFVHSGAFLFLFFLLVKSTKC